ncbi:hypothetical protein [Parahaliea mediterranea]|uniref:TonB-dependent receptor n=1 Tax=Parahaliea mediterranea TaxID=651086 RepID=A0A939IHK9_9GAMM|nr:hypothetical protein [Parahaliea mediterranea]MBN7795599.1 hypothetical protein [Parahaliea mediterranea]
MDMTAHGNLSYSDAYTFNPVRDIYANADAYLLTDARLDIGGFRVAGGEAKISCWVRNAFDEEYREWGVDFGVDGGAIPMAAATFGNPRSWGVDFVYSY